MFMRIALVAIGLPLALMGFGLTAAFGVLAFIGMPLMIVGLGFISAGVNPEP